ncbi:glycosyltransferase family 4 protein [Pectobacterium aroidearum]
MCLSLISHMDKKNIDITVLAFGDGEREPGFSKFSKIKKIKRANLKDIISFVQNNDFDIVHSHCIISDIFLFLSFMFGKKSKYKKITTIHNYPDKDSIYRRGQVIGGFLAKLQLLSIKNSYKVACSNAVKIYCEESLGLSNIIAIPNGVSSKQTNHKLHVGENKKNTVDFFYLGSLNERKNVELVLQAFKIWSPGKNANLHIIGDGELYQRLVNEYRSGDIIFHGKILNPYSIISQYDCFVSSSKSEGMPLALLESMSLGKTYICSDIGPHLEVHNASSDKAGFIFKLSDGINGVISAFNLFYNEKNKSNLYALSLDTYNKNYTSEIMANKYRDLYFYLHETYMHE